MRIDYKLKTEEIKSTWIPGTKVRRGKDWEYGNQDRGSIGQIIDYPYKNRMSDENYWVRVRWANGVDNTYRVGPFQFDLIIIKNEN